MSEAFNQRGPDPDPAWQETLDELFPPGGLVDWLHLYWEEGYPWEPCNRWMIGQVTPLERIPPVYLEHLDGPDPADLGYLFKGKWHSTVPISRKQWRFYQATGCLLKPYWVLQGTKGGHRYKYSRHERITIEINGGDPEAPYPGKLPYAVPDERTFLALTARDRLIIHEKTLAIKENKEKKGEMLSAEADADARVLREELWAWHSQHCEELAEHARSEAASGLWRDMPSYESVNPGEASIEEKLEKLHEEYITEGA